MGNAAAIVLAGGARRFLPADGALAQGFQIFEDGHGGFLIPR